MDATPKIKTELIVVIVEKDMSGEVIDAAQRSGAEGATVLTGRGSGIHEKAKFFGITIEPEKEVVLILVSEDIRKAVLKSIAKEIEIDKPNHGIAFVLDVTKVIGIQHLNLTEDVE